MIDQRLKDLRGGSRRSFLKWSAAVAAAIGLDRARYLNVLGESAGVAMADTAACGGTARSVHIIGDNGGLAWFTQLFPYPGVANAKPQGAALYAPASAKAAMTDKPLVYATDSPFQMLPPDKQMTVFVAGVNQTHTKTPTSGLQLGNNGLLAAVSAIQSATPSLLPVMAINPFTFGTAPGAASPATVANAAGLVDLFNSAASQTLLANPTDASLGEAYFKAFLDLNAAAPRGGVTKAYATGRVASNLLAKNLSAELAVSAADQARYGLTAGTPSSISEIGNALCTAVKAFKLGLTSSLILPAMQDDPHGAFQNMATLAANVKALGAIFNAFMADAMAAPDPAGCPGNTLGDSIVMTITGDTPKDALTSQGWPDGTQGNHNLLMVYGNGYLKTGWFGDMDDQGNVTTWDPTTGGAGTQSSAALGSPAGAAVAYAVAKGDSRRVSDFGVAVPPGVVKGKIM
jgi:hypothetical protein